MKFQTEIKKRAMKLANGDSVLADDLASEMNLTILELPDGKPDYHYLTRATDRARNYLRDRGREIPSGVLTDRGWQR